MYHYMLFFVSIGGHKAHQCGMDLRSKIFGALSGTKPHMYLSSCGQR